MANDVTTQQRVTEIQELSRAAFSGMDGAFRPFVVFDERLDCIRVVARDCSVTETRINGILTILEDNYPEERTQYVGFTVKGAKHFCVQHGLSISKPISVSFLLDKILKIFPEPAVEISINAVARQILKDHPEVNEVALEPQLAAT